MPQVPANPFVAPVTLTGPHARLEPLSHQHLDGLIDAVQDGQLHQLWYTAVPAPERMAEEIDRRLRLRDAGEWNPFTVFDAQGRVAGMTSFLHIDALQARVEIGATWTRASCQRSALNTQCKRLLLGHAFETLGCIAVELRTHRLNQQSRRAIERLGAQLDGILRAHQRLPDGSLRDTCVYSITASEWPTVRNHLQWQLDKPRQAL
ncbi:GNAT family N-acetyltransferase [Roseateles terrae]|uniref:RimJ/RimL family protein N-acetyltransferase n=1 Tax=Roseateles terrae TaxID=431060 RepID=A0ABR6GQK7_9BURK|nr:GNAT family protein [Roseateles terrae]MBB3194392.1 RimJ/RimL family protein N-acetyltransferase [Roseateles terrae]OWQ88222.1 N-acetyltransferase [Roseateles terrae]